MRPHPRDVSCPRLKKIQKKNRGRTNQACHFPETSYLPYRTVPYRTAPWQKNNTRAIAKAHSLRGKETHTHAHTNEHLDAVSRGTNKTRVCRTPEGNPVRASRLDFMCRLANNNTVRPPEGSRPCPKNKLTSKTHKIRYPPPHFTKSSTSRAPPPAPRQLLTCIWRLLAALSDRLFEPPRRDETFYRPPYVARAGEASKPREDGRGKEQND